jgi:hypothetical protein
MSIEAKDLKAGLAVTQDGKRVYVPKGGNYAVRPVSGGQFVKVNGQDVVKELSLMFPGCIFTWLSKPMEVEKNNGKKSKSGDDESPDSEAETK